MFELILNTGSISNEGAILQILENSDWSQSDLGSRATYGVYLDATYRISSSKDQVGLTNQIPQTDTEWGAHMVKGDGRYTFTGYAFPTQASYMGGEANGDLGYPVSPNILQQFDGAVWNTVDESRE